MSEEIDNLRQQLLLAGKYGQSLMIENNEVRALRIITIARSHPNHFLDYFHLFEQKGSFGQSSHVLLSFTLDRVGGGDGQYPENIASKESKK